MKKSTTHKEHTQPETTMKKSVSFSRKLVRDTFYVERIDKRMIPDLFYSEKDVIRFQIDLIRSTKRKGERRQASRSSLDEAVQSSSKREVSRSNSDGAVRSSSKEGVSRSSSDGELRSPSKRVSRNDLVEAVRSSSRKEVSRRDMDVVVRSSCKREVSRSDLDEAVRSSSKREVSRCKSDGAARPSSKKGISGSNSDEEMRSLSKIVVSRGDLDEAVRSSSKRKVSRNKSDGAVRSSSKKGISRCSSDGELRSLGERVVSRRDSEEAVRSSSKRGISRSNSDRAVRSSSNEDCEENSPRKSPKSKTSSKSSKMKGSKASATIHRLSDDDANVYVPRDESSKATTEDEDKSARCKDIVSKYTKELADKNAKSRKSSTRSSSSNKDFSGAKRSRAKEDVMLKTAVIMRQATPYQAGSDGLDTSDRSNHSLEPWTQDMLMLRAKQWKEKAAFKVANNPAMSPTGKEVKGEKMVLASPIKKSLADYDLSTESLKYENMSAASTEPLSDLSEDEYLDDSCVETLVELVEKKLTTQDELLIHAMKTVKAKRGGSSLSRLVRVLSTTAMKLSKGTEHDDDDDDDVEIDFVIHNKRMYPGV